MKKAVLLLFLIAFIYTGTDVAALQLVESDKPYTYRTLKKDLWQLRANYNQQLKIKTIGYSHFGRKIFAVRLGKGQNNIIIIGAHHGREWLTSTLTMAMLEHYAQAYKEKKNIGPFSSSLFDEISIWFVPMLNPDGVTVQQGELIKYPDFHRKRLLNMNEDSPDFTRWKANGMGIDLNRQYPAGWESLNQHPEFPSYKFYKGKRPFEAKEVQALVTLVEEINPRAAISYHSSGREIFWHYKNGSNTERDHRIAEKVSQLTGYSLSKPVKEATGGGFTDWFITAFHNPAMTIEICPLTEESNPPLSDFKEEWKRNQLVGVFLADEVKKTLKMDVKSQAK